MDYKKLSEESLDVIMQKLRDEIKKAKTEAPEISNNQHNVSTKIRKGMDFSALEHSISRASVGNTIGLTPVPMHAQRGLKRFIARVIRKIYLRVAELSNRDIRTANAAILTALVNIKSYLSDLSDRILKQQLHTESLFESASESIAHQNDELANMKRDICEYTKKNEDNINNEIVLIDEKIKILDERIKTLDEKIKTLNEKVTT
jgi:hypothetical protein